MAAGAWVLVAGTSPHGVYNCAAKGEISWYACTRAILETAGIAADLGPTAAGEYGAPVRRPTYSILDNAKLEAAGAPRSRHWREALVENLASRQ